MKCAQAVDEYLADRMRSGHITSDETVRTYRFFLDWLIKDTNNRDPALIGFQEIKVTLARWGNPNTYGQGRTAFNGFFKWLVREGHCKTNPVDRIDAPRTRKPQRRRLTRAEALAIMDACRNARERRAIYLTGCAGLRNKEVRHLRGRHFARRGFIWVSPDIAKGGRERWVPVGNDLQPIAEEIIANVDATELVLPSLRSFNPGVNSDMRPVANPLSTEGLIALISGIAARAGVEHRVTPHHLRHYFGEIATATAGIHTTQHLLGHQSIQTTQIYAGQPSLDDLTNAMNTIDFRLSPQIVALSPPPDRIRVNTS